MRTHISEKITFLINQLNKSKTKTAVDHDTLVAAAAFLVTVPFLYQVDGKTVPPENHR